MLPKYCAVIVLLLAALALMGWITGFGWLYHYGVPQHPIWPWTSLICLWLGLSLLALSLGAARAAQWALLPALAISAMAVCEYLTGLHVGFDHLLFNASVEAVHAPEQGRPGLGVVIMVILLATAIVIRAREREHGDQWILLLSGLSVGIGSISTVFLLLSDESAWEPIRSATSLPASLMCAVAAVGVLAFSEDMANREERGRADINLLVLIILALPPLMLLVQAAVVAAGLAPELPASLFTTCANVLIVIAILLWATNRVRRERDALLGSEQRLAIATDAHALGVFEWDVASGKIKWSAGAEQRMGIEPNTISDFESWSTHVSEEDLARIAETLEAAVARRSDRFGFNYKFRRTNGSVMFVEGSASCIYDHAGRLVRTLGVNLDVTDRELREATLQSREAQLRSILETVPDAMVVIDEHGTIRSFSAAAERMFGYTAAEMIGTNVSRLTPRAIEREHDGFLARYLVTGEKRVIGSTRYLNARRSDGSEIPIELSVGETHAGEERLFTGFIRDVSERLGAEERLSNLRGEYAHMARLTAMGEMAASLAHELNQPLAAAANFLGAARHVAATLPESEQLAYCMSNASGQVQRAGEIIRRLREFIARREVDVAIEPVEHTVRDAVALVLVGTAQLGVHVDYDFGPEVDHMLADRVQIQQVLVNLLRNALEALEGWPANRRTIMIAAKVCDDEMIEISVSDAGPGLSQEILDQIYTPFSSTKGTQGMGIGLSICRRIIEAHGGELEAENKASGGATFRFTLPGARLGEREQ